jgi:hypothetical protein
MFERYHEQARRAIFFARYEASQFGSPMIELEHLVLGVLRGYPGIPFATKEAVRRRIEQIIPAGEKSSTSVDLPLSHETERALRYADEASALKEDRIITPKELLLGVLRFEDSPAAQILREFKILSLITEQTQERPEEATEPSVEPASPRTVYASETLAPLVQRLEGLVAASESYLREIGEVGGDHVLKRTSWTKREALGHLVDWASTYHQWCAIVLAEPRLTAHSYPTEEWVSAQQYQHVSWRRLVSLWLGLNRFLIHVASLIPEAKLSVPCKVGIDPVQPFRALFERYLEHHEDLLGQILARN